MRQRLLRTIRGFASAIIIMLAFAWLFSLYTDTLSDDQQGSVLIKAIPFVAVFVSIILAFACLIVVVSVSLEGKVPQRSYRPIEGIIIAGILLGVVGLFQGWKLFAYEVGFLVVLVSLLSFMVWSHLSPMPARQSRKLPPLNHQAHIVGLVIGAIVWAIVGFAMISDAKPQEPYGFGQTLWNFKDDDEKAQIKDEAESEYQNAKIPVLIFVSLMPAAIVYLAVREIVAIPDTQKKKNGDSLSAQEVGASP